MSGSISNKMIQAMYLVINLQVDWAFLQLLIYIVLLSLIFESKDLG
jgi:hypothetical protein